MSKIKNITDGFKNIIKGLGTGKDPREATTFARGRVITQQVANDLYAYNWIAAKGIDIPIDDATKKWRSLLIPDADKKKEIEDIMNKFDVKGKINLASKWARVFGGAVIIIVIDGDMQDEPLDVERIRPGSLKNFIVLDRYNVHPGDIDRDILSENFGNPEYYMVSRAGSIIHHSRVIRFDGIVPTIMEAERNNFWGLSLFSRTFDSIADSGTMTQAIGNLVSEASMDVYKIKDLNDLVAEGDDKVVINRLKYLHQMKSVVNGSVLDADDSFEIKSQTFTTLPDIDDRYMQKVSGSFDIPLTRFLGVSPSGLNATGDSDMLNYHDNVSSIQENYIRPKVDIMDAVIIASSFGSEEIFKYVFNPLQQLSETEQSEVDLKNAQRDQIYLGENVITETDSMSQLAENGTYVTIDENRVEEAKAEEELNEEFEEEAEEENQIGLPSEEPEELGNELPEGNE